MKLVSVVVLLSLVLLSQSAVTTPIEAFGTVLPQLNYNSVSTPYRIFNDLMKQSLNLVPYQLSSWGSVGRCWSCSLNLINGAKHQYPANLQPNVWAVAEIPFFAGQDDSFKNKTFNVTFKGNGTIGVFQAGYYNLTWSGNSGGQFSLKVTNQSLFVYIYATDPTDPVNGITILNSQLGPSPPTFTSNFLKYLKPFNLLRTCYWQGQNIYNSGQTLQTWAGRPLTTSSTQVSSSGVALQHILELQKTASSTLWMCIPDSADTNYISKMATLVASARNRSQILYLEFGNVYTIMNDLPDIKSAPAFDTFMAAYGYAYRNKILFTANYRDIQYYINAMGGGRAAPYNFTYIDAIGAEPNFGVLGIADVWDATVDQIKSNLTHFMLQYETTLNNAYQIAKRNGTNLVTFSGGPYLKTPRYSYIWRNKTNSSYAVNASLELTLANTLFNMTQNDSWVGEYYLQWYARMKSMGIRSVLFSQLTTSYGPAFSFDWDFVPLVPFLNTTTPTYLALNQSVFNNRTTTLPISGTVPSDPSVCSPSCLWGDCILNICACYAGYSGADCSVYTPQAQQNKIGVNLQGLSYWTTQHPFIDMHREGSHWVYFIAGQGWNSGYAFKDQITFDTNGYPTYLPPGISVGTLMARDVVTHYDPGNYTILYDGDGVLTFGMFDVLKVVYGVGKCVLTVEPSTTLNNGILVTIERTNPANYIRNIRVIRPGYEKTWWTQKFSALMLEKLAPYGTLRFMDWTNTNGQRDIEWANRTQQSYRSYTIDNGVAWEEVIHLCNILGKNAWINVPHLATDDYITQLATLFLQKLEPHLKIYVEYSNEVWGTLFPGGQYAEKQGVQYYSNKSKITALNNATDDPTQARFCYLSMKTQNISDIWKAVWSTPANRARVNIVISPQAVNADTTRRILACENGYKKVDFVALAPYLSTTLQANMTNADVFAQLSTEITKIGQTLQEHLIYTNNYSLPLGCYEAGQGLLGSDTATLNIQKSVQDDYRMAATYQSYFEMLFNNSIVLACQYTDTGAQTKYGSWGVFEYADSRMNSSFKWSGIEQYLQLNNLPTTSLLYGSCNNSCNGNGICNFGRCSCYGDYKGDDCSIGKYVDFSECGYYCNFNNGTCVLMSTVGMNRYYGCNCNTGYIGNSCGIPVCSSKCSYNGICSAAEKCTCFRGKMGADCSVDCGCRGHGTCNLDGTCQCDTGYLYNATSKKCEFACLGQQSSNCYAPNLLSCNGCDKGTCKNGSCVCWPGYNGSSCSTESQVSYANSYLGINLGGLSYWSTQHLFKDYNKQSSQWIPLYYPNYFNGSIQYTWNTGEYFPTQPNGYPASLYANQSVAKLLLRDIQLRYPQINKTNEYVLLYDGDGIIKLGMDAQPYETSAGRIRFTVTPSTVLNNGIYINLIETNESNPVRNIRVVLAQDEYDFERDLVTEDFMKFISEFSTIRFMDLLSTNGNPVREWNQTTRYDMDTQAQPQGISYQLLAELIKRTGRNAWINVPHKASDHFVQQLAEYLYSHLPVNRIIYVQYSNQVWNAFFDQGKYAIAQATALGLANYHKFYAQRSLQIFNIFKNVFGGNSPRLKFVVSFQVVSKWVADQILTGTGLQGVAHIIAGGPYYDCDSIGNHANTAYFAGLTPADVLSKCNSSLSTLDPYLSIVNQLATEYNLSIAAYESGTSISQHDTIYTGNTNAAATANFIAANQNQGMYDIYKQLLYRYKNHNFTLNAPLNIFSSVGLPSKYGSWGVLDYMQQVNEVPTHPKFQAILDFNQGK